MLVLTRKTDEQIFIGDDIKITVVRLRGNSVRIGIDAPRDIRVVRGELTENDSKAAKEPAFQLDDREQVFAHPHAKIDSLRDVVEKHPKADADGADDSDAAVQSTITRVTTAPASVGKLCRQQHESQRLRAPLAAFVSAT